MSDINAQLVSIELSIAEWNVIFNSIPFLMGAGEFERIYKDLEKQFVGVKAENDKLTAKLTVYDFNLILGYLKLMPFYQVHNIIGGILVQGSQQIKHENETERDTTQGETDNAEQNKETK